VLIVKPTYRANWLLPGGTVDVGESPLRACRREVQEELGLSLPLGRLLCVDHRLAEPPRPDSLHFTFDGGFLDAIDIARIRLPPAELSDHRFAELDALPPLLTINILRRVRVALEQLTRGDAVYLEDLAVERDP
jgi:8-oxo-dGTP diphosphatase